MPTGRANHAAVAVEGRVHVVGGDRFKSAHEIYDPVDDVWSVGRPLPVGSQHLNYSAAPGQDGFFVFGGLEEGAHVSQRVLKYDLETGVWEERAPLPSPRQSAAAINFNGVIFVFGGIDDRFEGIARTDAYDPTSDAWERKADMPEARMVSGAAVVGDKIVVVAGIMLEETTSGVFLYDPHADEWVVGPTLPYPLTLAGVASVENRLYVAGGTDRETIFSDVLESTFPEMR
jgi:N-acetylneuraminic acid mutarotase